MEDIDESICLICGGSTYQGETISCETCMHWFHFQCVGVDHRDSCVVSEDVPFYCPSCAVAKNKAKPHMPSNKGSAKKALNNKTKQKSKKNAKNSLPTPQTSSHSKEKKKRKEIKLKISLKKSAKNKREKYGNTKKEEGKLEEDASADPDDKNGSDSQGGSGDESDDSSMEQPLIIDEIAPRIVKVGRRRPSQRQGANIEMKPEETLGLELKMENLEAFIQDDQQKSAQNLPTDEKSRKEVDDEKADVEFISQEDIKKECIQVRNLTARQRFKLEGVDCEESLLALDFSPGQRKKVEVKESSADKALKAQKRKDLETEKKEKIKKKTMDTLLKKKDSRMTKQMKVVRCQGVVGGFGNGSAVSPKITYVTNSRGRTLTFPASSWEYPLKQQVKIEAPKPVLCCICSNNLKKYSCAKTGNPLCSLACYKINLDRVNDIKCG